MHRRLSRCCLFLVTVSSVACHRPGDASSPQQKGLVIRRGDAGQSARRAAQSLLEELTSAPFQQSILSIVGSGKPLNLNTFEKLSAEIKVRGDIPEALRFTVDMGSGATNSDDVTTLLRGPAHFNAAQHPQATFISSEVSPTASPGDFVFRGELALAGENPQLGVAGDCAAWCKRARAHHQAVALERRLADGLRYASGCAARSAL